MRKYSVYVFVLVVGIFCLAFPSPGLLQEIPKVTSESIRSFYGYSSSEVSGPEEADSAETERSWVVRTAEKSQIQEEILPFGYDIFHISVDEMEKGPIEQDFVLSPGDEILVEC
jgi:hypothetical protein